MTTRTVHIAGFPPVFNVTDDFSDEDVRQKLESRDLSAIETTIRTVETPTPERAVVEEEEDPYGARVDIGRSALRTGQAIYNFVSDPIGLNQTIVDKFGPDLNFESPSLTTKSGEPPSTPLRYRDLIPRKIRDPFFTDDWEIKETHTLGGAAADIVPYIIGAKKLFAKKAITSIGTAITNVTKRGLAPALGARAAVKTARATGNVSRSLIVGAVTDLAVTNTDINIFNMIENQWPESTPDFVEFMALKEEDPKIVERLKVVGEGLILGGLFELLGGVVKVGLIARKKFKKPVSQLTPEERGELFVDRLRELKESTDVLKNTKEIEFSETAEGAAQVAQQNSSRLNRWANQAFKSRGYWTPQAHHAFETAENAQRALISRSEHIAGRLQTQLDKIVYEADYKEAAEQIDSLLRADLSFIKDLSPEETIKKLMKDNNLSEEIASEIYLARTLVDDLSGAMLNSKALDPKSILATTVAENSGSYLRTSYRLYEDVGYTPTAKARNDAKTFLIGQYTKGVDGKSIEEATKIADNKLDEIIGTVKDKQEGFGLGMDRVRKVNKEILKEKKDLPPEIRTFMGEIKEPAENIILTVSKMAKFVETSKFYENLDKLGREGKYIYAEGAGRPDGVWEKIKNTNSILDGKYTTPEINIAIKQQESVIDFISNTDAGQTLMYMKGLSQKAKTVYSHQTHLRNIGSGAFFGVANGLNPFNKGLATTKLLANEIGNKGSLASDDMYEKYLRLGIINTNVGVNEFRKLLDSGYESSLGGGIEKFGKNLQGYGLGVGATARGANKAADFAESFYLATDDFYKINGYLSELDTLKKAKPDVDIADLELEAANIIKNTFPNYDRVPKFIKGLRQIPLIGNFVAFPSEILRNTAHIGRQAFSEISSGNKVLAMRGAKRLAGLTAVSTGWSAASWGSAQLLGMNLDEKKSLDVITATPWSPSAPRIYSRFDDKIFAMDTQFINPYSVITDIYKAPMKEISEGLVRGEDIDDYLLDAVIASGKNLLSPYISESLMSEALSDINFARKDDSGRTPDGKLLFPTSNNWFDHTGAALEHLAMSLAPGSVTSLVGLAETVKEKQQPTTGSTKNLESELLANFTGVRFTEVKIQDRLRFASNEYLAIKRTAVTGSPVHGNTPEEIMDNYYKRQANLFKGAQELQSVFDASTILTSLDETYTTIARQTALTKQERGFLAAGFFTPEKITVNDLRNYNKKVNFTDSDKTFSELVVSLQQMYADMVATPLSMPREERIETEQQFPSLDLKKLAIGGEVDVPQAPAEPDQRIDKMTGLPYNEQAGGAFIDVEERAGFAAGSFVKGLANIIKTYSKKEISEEAAEKAATRMSNMYTPEELADPKIQEFTQTSTRSLLDEKHDMTIDQMREQGWQGDIGGDEFSTWRGYTREEKDTFNRASQLADELPFDSQDFNYEMTNALDEINARDLDSTVDEIEANYLKEIEDAIAAGDEDLANTLENELELALENLNEAPKAATATATVPVVSKLDNALDKLIKRDQPIPLKSFENFLKNEGVSKVEIENSEVLDSIKFLGKNLDDAGGNIPESEILTRGRLTPDTIKTLKETRRDTDQFGVRTVDPTAEAKDVPGTYKIELNKYLEELQASGEIRDYKVGIDAEGFPTLEDVELTAKGYNVYIDDERLAEGVSAFKQFEQVAQDYTAERSWYFLDNDFEKDLFETIVLPSTNPDTYKIRLYNDPRLNATSGHFPEEGEFAFHTRTDVEDDAVRILEIQSDQLNALLFPLSKEIETSREFLSTAKRSHPARESTQRHLANAQEKYREAQFNYPKYAILGEIQRAYDEGLSRVEIAIKPSDVSSLIRSKEVQNRYETEIPKIARTVAKNIGAEIKMVDGWLVIDLPAIDSGVTIPRYNEGGKVLKACSA